MSSSLRIRSWLGERDERDRGRDGRANRGIGLEVVRQLAERGMHVVLTARDEAKGTAAAAGLAGEVRVAALDVSDQDSVRAVRALG